ncbi:MAG TPA: 3-hydroxyacyl-CoA dehydrogenase family protein [Syntrophales bacterium]|mgnify:CR=1 FL=1|nr:3-hydroxyacyl-CoA dehydrogenase family protein [Syntrophales bacterium]HOM06124.1 3-hydroxyacyl-CoA dehydrogenase family protein [Syntrophales bacterium]HON99012.1 3-hydroxyacyl-CoA dehydrogenase family protein [Syntrophales bacterium]HPC00978.1 3-hydroxyacyl-CoA dehydrogenase family protein [Syntrophales bacterium]HPQ05607.1 3-hydroxyacyl-CoA dehydrogenase family protein [Syntrophales bacterium]
MSGKEIEKIAVLGGGLIGAGWAVNFLWKGYPTAVYDVSEEALEAARKRVSGSFDYLAAKGIVSADQARVAMGLARYTTDIAAALKDADLIQEAAPERYEVKRDLLAQVDRFAKEEAVFASSTSGLLISRIAEGSKHPERCLGAHPYNPPYLIPLVEISKGEKTAEEYLQRAYDFYRALGKEPIILRKEALGFIANRISVALYREAVDLVWRGVCSVADVDKAVTFGPGLRLALMGPNLIYQLGGGQYGVKGILHHIGPTVEDWWADMADWKKWPEGWGDMAQEGVLKEMEERPASQGRTPEEIARWRDDGLITLLRFHGKI